MSIRVMTRVWETSTAKGSALLLLLAIADWADDAGRAFPSIPAMARKVRMSERHVQKLVAILVRMGELRVEQQLAPEGRNLVNLYHVVTREGGWQVDTLGVASPAGGRVSPTTPRTVRNRHTYSKGVAPVPPSPGRCPECRDYLIEHNRAGCRRCAERGKSCAAQVWAP